jgi:LysM repeat protein
MPVTKTVRPHWRRRVPIWITGNIVALVVLGMLFVAPSMTTTAAAAACGWYTVKSGDTLSDIGTANNSSAPAIAAANHISPKASLYVGQKLCVPTAWYAAASAKPYVPPAAAPALPAGILAGEPCTSDRSIVWTGVIGRWTIPPGCFGLIYYPDPAKYMVNGHEIGGFGWCNWWPEALLRNPNVLNWPGHAAPRVGFPVWYAPQYGEHLGHYAFVESIGSGVNSGWLLISEMNMYWRGGGWAAVDYRYIRADYPGASYLYPN